MERLAPAKINLHLRVGKRRGDGFHPLLTWMVTVGLFDSLTLEAAAPATDRVEVSPGLVDPVEPNRFGGPALGASAAPPAMRRVGRGAAFPGEAGACAAPAGVSVEFHCDGAGPDLPRDGRNLVVRVARAFLEEAFDEAFRGGRAFGAEGDAAAPPARLAQANPARVGQRPTSAGAARVEALGTPGDTPDVCGKFVIADPAVAGVSAVRDAEQVGPDAVAPGALAGVRIGLTKRIPVGAGLGGGSSDAARTLAGLNELLAAGWAAERLSDFAARFGSDVPFFFFAPSAACRGRGEVVRPVATPAARWAVLVLPEFGLATKDVYARFDEMGLGHDEALEEAAEPDWGEWSRLPAKLLLARLVNDLEPAAFSLSATLARLSEDVERRLGRLVRMSGSGSSLFTLYDDEPSAREAAERVGAECGTRAVAAEVGPRLDGGPAGRLECGGN